MWHNAEVRGQEQQRNADRPSGRRHDPIRIPRKALSEQTATFAGDQRQRIRKNVKPDAVWQVFEGPATGYAAVT
ncbi:hypothetical protein B1987_27465 [Mycobacterium kansasii]|nr:hypothetical protein B1987_27465 [Mycobacterium kansasii]